jgi:asparagine synthase (glutamine-hydrolysing)
MCGIIGMVGEFSGSEQARLEQARDLMYLRGPDDAGSFTIGVANFGFRRLAILDLTTAGHQPMVSLDGQVALVFNGEIYNYQSLRTELQKTHEFRSDTDTEVILNGYLAWGWSEMLQRIDGMFAIAVWDNRKRSLYAARDRVGKKPFFYQNTAKGLYFASTLNALRALMPTTPEVDPIALDAYLTYQAIPAPFTAYKDVYQLPPAHQLIYQEDNKRLEVSRYWDVRYDQKTQQSEAEILDELDTLVRQAVRRRLISDVPLGAFLSGGVDSSLVVAMMAQEKSEPVDAIVMGFDDPVYDERPYARQVAQHLGADKVNLHEHLLTPNAVVDLPEIIWQYGQPLADVSIVPTYYVAKAAREHVTVVLNGDGGDELFAGYARPIIAGATAPYRQILPAPLRLVLGQWLSGINNGPLKRLSMLATAGQGTAAEAFVYNRSFRLHRNEAYTETLLQALTGYHPDALYRDVWQRAKATDDVDRALYGDFTTYLPDQLLSKMDVSTMACSLEARSPLLDVSLIEYAARIPTKHRIKGYTTKYLLKRLAERYVPREVLYRRKRGFVMPAADWLKGELAPYLGAALQSSQFKERGWLKTEFVGRMLQEHTTGQRNWGEQLWTLFVLEIWARMMLDNSLSRHDSLEALL